MRKAEKRGTSERRREGLGRVQGKDMQRQRETGRQVGMGRAGRAGGAGRAGRGRHDT